MARMSVEAPRIDGIRQFVLILVPLGIMIVALAVIAWDVRGDTLLSPTTKERVEWIKSQHLPESYLVRGESICADGCPRADLRTPQHRFHVPANSKAYVSRLDGSEQRVVAFPACRDWGIHRFGLSKAGEVYVTYFGARQWDVCVIDPGPYQMVSLQNGRLYFH